MSTNSIPKKTVLIVVSGSAIGVLIIGALAMYFRRRKKRINLDSADIAKEITETENDSTKTQKIVRRQIRRRMFSINNNSYFSPKKDSSQEDTLTKSKEKKSSESFKLSQSENPDICSDSDDVISDDYHSSVSENGFYEDASQSDANSLATTIIPSTHLTPSQLLEAGMDMILKAQTRWKIAIDMLEDSSLNQEEKFKIRAQLSQLLDLSDAMKSSCSEELLSQLCAGAVVDAALVEMDREYEATKLKYLADDNSDLESFYSTLETIDISNIEEHKETFQHFHLYEQGLHHLENGNLPYRCLRTELLDCSSDTEFLAKLYCIRKAFDLVFSDEDNRIFFEKLGRDLVKHLLTHSEKETKEFENSYDDLMSYLKVPENWISIEEELKLRNVRVMSFFDIVIDFLLFDAFDDLDMAPASIVSIINNNWITNGFKETAILTFVWSVLKAKKAMLKQTNGFMSRFYSISEVTSPVLAWGFLGPQGPVKLMCFYFKDQIMSYVKDIFDFNHVRYTNAQDLSEDLMMLARLRGQKARDKLSIHPSMWHTK